MSILLSYELIPELVPFEAPDPDPIATLALQGFATIALDTTTGDLKIPFEIIRGVPAIAQMIAIRLRQELEEWFLDLRVGIPFRQRVFVVNPSDRTLRRIFTAAIQQTPGVARVDDLRVVQDRQRRIVTIDNFKIRLADGSLLVSRPSAPFIIEGTS